MKTRTPGRQAVAPSDTPALPPLTLQQALDIAELATPAPALAHAALQRLKVELPDPSGRPLDDHLGELGFCLSRVAILGSAPELQALLGGSLRQEMLTMAAGFRQRFPQHWPSAQQTLPLD